ncbi:TPA: attachment protein, partial [Pseudomonas aeruginosa]
MPRFVLLIFALVLASAAHADFYQWKISIPGKPTAFFPSYTAACQYYFDNTSANWLKKINKLSYDVVQCSVSGTGGITWEPSAAILTGDSCPEGTDFNKEIGECKENKCEILAGSLYEKSHQAPISRFINYLGCEIAVSSIDGCIGPAEGQAGATYCKVIGSFTGNWFTSNGSCAFGCDVGPGDGPPPGGDGGTGGDGGSNPPGGDGGSDGGTKPGNGGGDDGSSGGGGGG